jgi:hypothetical protein
VTSNVGSTGRRGALRAVPEVRLGRSRSGTSERRQPTRPGRRHVLERR